jgi:hypothetical protein
MAPDIMQLVITISVLVLCLRQYFSGMVLFRAADRRQPKEREILRVSASGTAFWPLRAQMYLTLSHTEML